MLEEPTDFVGFLFAHTVSKQLENPEIESRVRNWKMTVVVDTNYYPVTIEFNDGVRIIRKFIDNPTLIVKISMDTISHIIKGELSPFRAFLSGDIKVKGMFRHPLALKRFYGLIIGTLKG